MKYAPYSFSRINTYENCKQKFKFAYILKSPKQETDNTALLKGSAIHSMLEHFPEPSGHSLVGKYFHIFEKFIRSELGSKYLSVDHISELSFGMDKNLEPCSYSDKEAIFRGFVDYSAVIDNTLYICDWKTGKYKEEKWQNYNQLMFYAIYFFMKYPHINTIKISYVYVEHNTENEMILERQYLDNYKSTLLNLINNIEEEEKFPKNIGSLCSYCEYSEHCSS